MKCYEEKSRKKESGAEQSRAEQRLPVVLSYSEPTCSILFISCRFLSWSRNKSLYGRGNGQEYEIYGWKRREEKRTGRMQSDESIALAMARK